MTSIEVELVMSLLAMSLGLGLHQQKGQDRGRWLGAPKGYKQHGCFWAWLYSKKALVGTGWAISLFLCMHLLQKVLWPCGASISDNDAYF